MLAPTFKIGDVVRLKSGSEVIYMADLTPAWQKQAEKEPEFTGKVRVDWQDKAGKSTYNQYHQDMLELA